VIVAVVLAFAFLWVIRVMLARGSETAGPSQTVIDAVEPTKVLPQPTAIETRSAEAWVYKCKGSDGVVAFQSQPCASGAEMLDRIAATPDTAADISWARTKQLEAIRRSRQMAELASDGARGYGSAGTVDERRARCNAAKAARDDTLRRVGLARTYELLQRLDNQVREACKGVEP
jgi:hypothetical protein